MKWTQAFIPTLRDDPADAEAVSHKLLVRAGFARQLVSGIYSLLPLGFRVARKVEGIVRDELEKIGAQEFQLPCMHPTEIWEQTGRGEIPESFRLKDRHGADLVLGLTHEEIFTHLSRELRSYKELPQTWFQFQTKFRDEERPKSGLLRVREFVMKDSYSFDYTLEGLDHQFQQHFEAYRRIFERCGLDTVAVEASSGAMGGSESIEFMVQTESGEDWVVTCELCGYAANIEKATSTLAPAEDAPGMDAPEKFPTPGVVTIQALVDFEGGAPADGQIKTLVYVVDGSPLLALLRGDHDLVEQKLIDATGASDLRPAGESEIQTLLGARPGSLGAVGLSDEIRVLADPAIQGRTGMVTGANEDGFHFRGVDVARDVSVTEWVDLREVKDGESCPACENKLTLQKTVEVAHIFKLGTKYSEALGAKVLDENGKNVPLIMGSYGIGIGRAVAAIVERHNDENGIIWPVNVAPFEVVVTVVKPKEVACHEAGERIYETLLGAGIDVLLDDRDVGPGVKFKDAELVGIPYRITVGPKGLADGTVEVFRRQGARKRDLPVDRAAEAVTENVLEDRR